MAKNVVVIIADGATGRAGEADYTLSLAAAIKSYGLKEDLVPLFYRTQPEGLPPAAAAGDPYTSPLNRKEYAEVPYISPAAVDELRAAENITIIGAGHSTLATVADLLRQLAGRNIHAGYVTHMVDNEAHLQEIVDNNITLFATTTQESLASISPALAKQVAFVPLDAVPHTNTPAACEAEYATFKRVIPGRVARVYERVVEGNEPFAFVVLNAGFKVGRSRLYLAWSKACICKLKGPSLKIGKDERHVPYKIREAAEDGAVLANGFAARTNLILAHGGPRNLRDDRMGRRRRMGAFARAYSQAQAEKFGVRPKIIRERFKPGLAYNAIKVGYYLARVRDNCVAFICNSEGYGTMDGAVQNIDNQAMRHGGRFLLAMFPFAAQYADSTGQRQANIRKYNQRGIAILTAMRRKLFVERHPEENVTPSKTEDPARRILGDLGLLKTPAPVRGESGLKC